jgi:elongation factor 3
MTYIRLFIGSEIWNMEGGHITHQGKATVIEDVFLDTPKSSRANTPMRSRLQTPVASASGTPVASGTEDAGATKLPAKKKKLTRNQLKAREERRRLRKLHWLTVGGPKPDDTDSDDDP